MTKRRKIVHAAAAIAMALAVAVTPAKVTRAATVGSVTTADGANEVTFKPGDTVQLYAHVDPDYDGEDTSVSWFVQGNNSNDTFITQDGLLTIGLDETSTMMAVGAVSNSTPENDPGFFLPDLDLGNDDPDPTPTYADITSVTVSGPDTMAPGEEEKFTVDIQGNGIFEKNATWSVEGNTSANTTITGNTDGSATLHVASDETADTLTVIATPLANPNVPGSKTVTITHNDEPEEPTVTEVRWISGTGYIVKGTSDYFTAEVRGTGNFDTSLVWTLTGNTSSGTFVNENGVVTVAADETASSLTVRAASKADPDKYVESTFEVREPEVVTKVTGVQIGGAKEMKKGSSDLFMARAVGIGDIDRSVTWTVAGNTSKDTVIAADGTLTVGKDETAAKLTVTATSVQDPTVSESMVVTVKEADKSENSEKSEESTNTDDSKNSEKSETSTDESKNSEKPSTIEESKTVENNESTSVTTQTETTASDNTSAVPKTGDSQRAGMWGLMGIVSTALAAAFTAMSKRKEKTE